MTLAQVDSPASPVWQSYESKGRGRGHPTLPTPEPATYGVCFTLLALALVAARRFRSRL